MNRRKAAAGVGIAVLMAFGPAATRPAIALQGNGWQCSPSASVQLVYTAQATGFDAPVNDPCSTNSSPGSGWTPPPNGSSCSHEEGAPVLSVVDNHDGITTVTWLDPRPPGTSITSMTVPTANLWGDVSRAQAGEEQFLWFPFQGTWQNGVCTGSYIRSLCPKLSSINAFPLALPACMVPAPIPVGTGIPIVGPLLVDLQGQLRAKVHPGTIAPLPSSGGLAQAASCFSLNRPAIPREQLFRLVLAGPDGIIYNLYIDLSFADVTWTFDDSNDPANLVAPIPPECPAGPLATAHIYTQTSDKGPNPDGTYHVSASINFGIQATEYWRDGIGGSIPHGPVSVFSGTLSVPVPPMPYRVFQEQGVPIGPSPGP